MSSDYVKESNRFRNKPIGFKPCICGHNYRDKYRNKEGMIYFECEQCGLAAKPGNAEWQARLNWNALVSEYLKPSEFEKVERGEVSEKYGQVGFNNSEYESFDRD